MEREFKVGDKVKFTIGNGTYYGTVSDNDGKAGCRISRKMSPDAWVNYHCITKLQKRKQPKNPVPASRGISRNDIEGLIRLTMQDVFQRTMLEKKEVTE